jgi:proteasome lid subunit RPN8/RPN11
MPLVLLNIVMIKKGVSSTVCVCCVYLFNCVVQQEELWSVSSVNEEVKEESADEHQVCPERLVDLHHIMTATLHIPPMCKCTLSISAFQQNVDRFFPSSLQS